MNLQVTGRAEIIHKFREGFTLVELLVVLSILALLSSLLLPTLAVARQRAQGLVCLGNLRQIQTAMLLYATDQEDFAVWNADYVRKSWVFSGEYERAAVRPIGCTNLDWLVQPHFAAHADYIKAAAVYRCPGDRTRVRLAGCSQPWVRSYGASFLQRKMSDFESLSSLGTRVSPALHRTFDEVHPGYLVCLGGVYVNPDSFVTFPSSRHDRAGTFAFADGHVELHRWVDRRTLRPSSESMSFGSDGCSQTICSSGNADLEWLCRRSDSGLGYNRQDADILRAVQADPTLCQLFPLP